MIGDSFWAVPVAEVSGLGEVRAVAAIAELAAADLIRPALSCVAVPPARSAISVRTLVRRCRR